MVNLPIPCKITPSRKSPSRSPSPSNTNTGAEVSVYVRWRPLIEEEAGHQELTRTVKPQGNMQRVIFSAEKMLAGTNISKKVLEEEVEPSLNAPETPRTKRRNAFARRMKKREEKANTFDGLLNGVFESDQNNQAVFQGCVKDCVDHVNSGGVGAVFTYGQTGSGKTHTILGYGEERGLAYQAMEQMQKVVERLNREDVYVNVSFTEMHKRSVYDLLNNRNAAAARENEDGDVVFRKYTREKSMTRDDSEGEGFSVKKIKCRSAQDAAAVIQQGIDCRVVGNSNLHSQSSRSHAFLEYELTTDKIEFYKSLAIKLDSEINRIVNMIGKPKKPRCHEKGKSKGVKRFTLDQDQKRNQVFLDFMTEEQLNHTIKGRGHAGLQEFYGYLIKQVEKHVAKIKAQEGPAFKGKMVLVDLAGSEHGADKRNKTQTAEEWQEAKQINISLSALNDVILAQYKGKKRVPYRASILTRILRKYLSDPNCKTVMIGNLSPSTIHSTKTMKTLRYCRLVAQAGSEL